MASVLLHTVAVHRILKENSCGCQAQLGLLRKMVHPNAVQFREMPERGVRFHILPKHLHLYSVLLKGDEITKLEKTSQDAGSNLFLQFPTCLAHPKCNSKSWRWREAETATRMADMVLLAVSRLQK